MQRYEEYLECANLFGILINREETFVTSNPPQRFLNASSSRGLRKSRIVVGFLGCPGGFSELRCKVTMRIMVFANFSRKKIKKSEKIAPLSHFHTFTHFEQ